MNGIKVQGKVIEMSKDEVDSETNGNGIVYTSTYQFRTQSGDLITGSSEHGDDVGDVVTVIYNPNDPHENRIEGDSDKTLSGAIPRSLLTLLFALAVGWFGVTKILEGVRPKPDVNFA